MKVFHIPGQLPCQLEKVIGRHSTGPGEDDRGGMSSKQTSTAQHSAAQETGGAVPAPTPASSAPVAVPVPTPTDRPAIAPRVRLLALNNSAITQRSNGIYEPRVRMRVSWSVYHVSVTTNERTLNCFSPHSHTAPCLPVYISHDTSTDRKQPAVAAPATLDSLALPSPALLACRWTASTKRCLLLCVVVLVACTAGCFVAGCRLPLRTSSHLRVICWSLWLGYVS